LHYYDAAHTVSWNGIANVKDSSGNSHEISSASGTNYINAIPEPGAKGLLAVHSLTVLLFRRRCAILR
jgi:hypothetical protein